MYSLYKNEYSILKSVEKIYERDSSRKKKNRGDEPSQAIIHIYMEEPEGNSLCSYLLQNQKIGGKNRSCLGELIPARVGVCVGGGGGRV
jgi:hypothetical protein